MRSPRVLGLALAVVAASTVVASVAPGSAQTKRAAQTNRAAQASRVEQASRAGQADPARPPGSASACERGDALEDLGRFAQATQAYLEGLERRATLKCASEALAQLDNTNKLCEMAKALDKAGRRAEARAAYLVVLRDVPDSECARRGAAPKRSRDFWPWLGNAVKNGANLVIAAAVVLLSAAAIVTLTFALAARWGPLKNTRMLRWVRRPVLQIDPLDDSAMSQRVGPAITAVLRTELAGRAEASQARMYLVSTEAAAADVLGGLSTVAPTAAVAGAFLRLVRTVTPRTDWRVRGELQPAGERGYGLTLALQEGRRYSDFTSFWSGTDPGAIPAREGLAAGAPGAAPPTPPSSAGEGGPNGALEAGASAGVASQAEHRSAAEIFRQLAVPAAGWVDHHHSAERFPERQLTSDAVSWAMVYAGVYWSERGRRDVAMKYYERALRMDAKNVGALANLGAAQMQERHDEDAERHLRRAVDVIEESEKPGRAPAKYRANWYRAMWALAAVYTNRSQRTDISRDKRQLARDEAAKTARKLARTTIDTRTELGLRFWRHPIRTLKRWWRLLPSERRHLDRFLGDTLEPSVLLLYAYQLKKAVPKTRAREAVIAEVKKDVDDAPPDAGILVGYVTALAERTAGVEYMMACLYTQWEQFEAAAKHLERGLEATPTAMQRAQFEEALSDPTLKPLWEAHEGQELEDRLGARLRSEESAVAGPVR